MGKKRELRQLLLDGLQNLQTARTDDLAEVADDVASDLLAWRDANTEPPTRRSSVLHIAAVLRVVAAELDRVESDVPLLSMFELTEQFGRHVDPDRVLLTIAQSLEDNA